MKKGGAIAGVIGVAAAAILTPFLGNWESGGPPKLVAYRDIVGVWTLCDGETKGVHAGMTETPQGCRLRLDKRVAQDFAPKVLACTPLLRGHDYQLAAAISLSYNIGTGAYCKSTVDRRFDSGPRNWASACDAFLLWNKAGGKVVRGLDNRRRAERSLCLTELPK
ncbi:MAG: lysozyme [Chthoniobacterales bacterium]|nr:lysozyme [Chthoniobacterales bacterium]